MKIVIAPQTFKGTISASQAAASMAKAVNRIIPDAEIVMIPIADGGSGTVEALVTSTGGYYINSPTLDPIGRPIMARWGVLGNNTTAVVESSSASGLALLNIEHRDPTKTSTRGTGKLILAALKEGFRDILVGLGDSATNDGGIGIAQELGVRILDRAGNEVQDGGGHLTSICKLDISGLYESVSDTQFTILCDVNNQLCGPNGASAVFGPQKGASDEQVVSLDCGLQHLSNLIEAEMGINVSNIDGAGAGGGSGAALMAFCGANLRPGFELLSDILNLAELLTDADVVLTGEGSLDNQTFNGKGVSGIAKIINGSKNTRLIAIVGQNKLQSKQIEALGINKAVALPVGAKDVTNTDETSMMIESTTEEILTDLIRRRPYDH